MAKGKLQKFAEMETFPNVFQCPYSIVEHEPFVMKGRWHEDYFDNDNPIILELGCGKGEYTVGLARRYPKMNFIGVDIKGARMYTGAKTALEEKLSNVAFLRTNIEIIDRFFSEDEVSEIWLTFSDPQMKNPRKRLSSTFFLKRYQKFLKNNATVHLKTDSNFLFTYTDLMISHNHLNCQFKTSDLYHTEIDDEKVKDILSIRTYYEQQWIERGLNIKYLKFQLPTQAYLEESEIEIPLDDYRSYHRNKRSSKDIAR